jgi:hypothetical protein
MQAMQNKLQTRFLALAVVAMVAITAFAYAPGLRGVFVFDSVERVARNDALRISAISPEQLLGAAYSGQADYPRRGLAFVSLALNYYLSGQQFDPFVFKLTNLFIHILNGLLVLILARLVIARWWHLANAGTDPAPSMRFLVLAVVAASVWVLHPIQLTSVLYVIQRMTSLAATWVLIGASVFVVARTRLEERRAHSFALMYGAVIVCTGVGFLFKQNALLLPAFIATLELFLFDRQLMQASHKRKLLLFFALVLMLPILAGVVLVTFGASSSVGSYEFRDFGILERLFTQARVLFFYLGLLAVPNIRRFGLYHDDIAASVGLLDPWTTLVAIMAWAVVVIALVRGARNRAPWAFAVSWFLIGHAMESSVLPLELVHEHRNYVPGIGIWIALAYYAGTVWDKAGRLRALLGAVVVVWVVALALVTHIRAETWRSAAVLMESLSRHHPQSYRALSGYAFNSVPVSSDLGIRFDAFQRAAVLTSEGVSALIEMSKIATALGGYLASQEPAPITATDKGASPGIASMELRADGGYNARLLSALDAEISHRLAAQRPRTGNIVALVSLVDCSLEGVRECASLRDNARRWHVSALSNGRMPAHFRAVLELSLAKLYAIGGDDDEAVRHAQLAGRSAANNLNYRLREAMLYALLERWRELGDALADIEARFPVRAKSDTAFRDLQGRYNRNRNE